MAKSLVSVTHMGSKTLKMARDYGLAAFMGGAGVMHFVNPGFFEAVVPGWFPVDNSTTVAVSGVAEIAAGALVAIPRTRRLGGWASLAVLVSVFPANVDGAVNGGYEKFDPPMNSPLAAWARLPLQFPMFYWAYKVATGQGE